MIAMFELFVNNTYIVLLQHSPQVATDSRIMKWIHGPIQGNIDGTVHHIVPSSRETRNLRVKTEVISKKIMCSIQITRI
jgi:hypothetical protein